MADHIISVIERLLIEGKAQFARDNAAITDSVKRLTKEVKDNGITIVSNGKKVQNSYKGAASATEKLGKSVTTLDTSYKRLNISAKKITSQVRVLSTAEDENGNVIGQSTREIRKHGGEIYITTSKYKVLAKESTLLSRDIKQINTSWKTTSQTLGPHGKKISETQVRYKKLGDEYVRVTRHKKLLGDKFKVVDNAMGSSKNQVDSFLGHITKLRWAFVNLTMAIGVVMSIVKFASWGAEIEKAMYKVSSVTQESVEKVTAAAKELREGTIFSLEEVGESMLMVSKKGYTLSETMDIVHASTILAVGGFTDLETASTAITQVLKLFNLDTAESINIVNALSYVALNTAASVEDLTTAMGYVGPMAQIAGMETEEMVSVLGMLRDKGLSASKASTALRGVIAKMIDPSRQAEEEMNKINLTFFDADGNMKGLSRSIRSLGSALEKLPTQQEKLKLIMDIFGIRPSAGAAALIDIAEQSTFAIDNMTASAKMSTIAQEAYDKQMEASANTMKATIEDLKSSASDTSTFMAKLGVSIAEVFGATPKQKEFKLGINTLIDLFDAGKISATEFEEAAGQTLKSATGLGRGAYETSQLENIDKIKTLILDVRDAQQKADADAIESASKKAFANEKYRDMITQILAEKRKELGMDKEGIDLKRKYQDELSGVIQANVQYNSELLTQLELELAIKAVEEGRFGDAQRYIDQAEKRAIAIDEETGAIAKFKSTLTLLTEEEEKSGSKVKVLTQEYEKLKTEWYSIYDAAVNLDGITQTQRIHYIELRDAVLAYKLSEIEKAKATEISNVTASSGSKIAILYTITMARLTKEIKEQQDVYNTYAKARFVGETAALDNIHKIGLEIRKEELAELKLKDAIGATTGSLKAQKDEYKAWVDTTHEAIRGLIEEGNLTATNVSKLVKAQQTKLLATSKFSKAQDNENEKLKELQLQQKIAQAEYDVGIGEKRYQLGEYIYALEHQGEVEWNTAKEAIDAMTSVKDKIDTMTTKQKGIEERWQEARWQVSLYKAGISDAAKAIKGDIDNNITWVNNLIKEYKKLATQINNMPSYSSGGGSGGGGWSGTVVGGSGTSGGEFAPTSGTQHGNIGGGTITTVISPGVWFDETGGHSGGAPEVDDNPWLMAEGGLVTKPTSAIIGEAGPELVIPLSKLTSSSSNDTDGNQTISIGEINISGVSGDADDFAREFTDAIERELRTR